MKGTRKDGMDYRVVRDFSHAGPWTVKLTTDLIPTLALVALHSTWTTENEADKVAKQLNKEDIDRWKAQWK
jgi:hypothetical protein